MGPGRAAPPAGPGAAGRPPRPRPDPRGRLSSWFSVPPAAPARPSPLPLPLRHFIPPQIPGPRRSLPHLPAFKGCALGPKPRPHRSPRALPGHPLRPGTPGSAPFQGAQAPCSASLPRVPRFMSMADCTNAPSAREPQLPSTSGMVLELQTCPSSDVSRNVFAGQALPDLHVPDLSDDSARQQRLSPA